jgi:hypothetical protein
MKNARVLIAAVLLSTAASLCLQAQERQLLTVTVPFAFTAENVTLPAGDYRVYTLPPYNMIKLQSSDGRKIATVPAIPTSSQESEQGKLVFHRLGGQYFLAQIWEEGIGVRRDLRMGRIARELAEKGEKMQSATVLASARSSH